MIKAPLGQAEVVSELTVEHLPPSTGKSKPIWSAEAMLQRRAGRAFAIRSRPKKAGNLSAARCW
ncbi:MAG: hypothetical protein ACK44E_06095 [Anaerolineales bacterium]